MTMLKFKNNTGMQRYFDTRPVFSELFNDMFDNFLTTDVNRKTVPAVNIKESENKFNVSLAAPGLSKEDFKLHVEDGVLSISAEQKDEKTETNDRYTRREFSYNSFKRSFSLPEHVDSSKITAAYENGILSIDLPKMVEEKQKNVQEIKIG